MLGFRVALLFIIAAHVAGMQTRRQQDAESCVPAGMRRAHIGYGPGAFDMVVLGSDDILSNVVLQHHSWEVLDPQQIADVAGGSMPSNGTFLDLGANIGYYSLLFARRGFKVIAVEPMARNRKALEASLCLNPELKSLVTLVPVALVGLGNWTKANCGIRSTSVTTNVGNGHLTCGEPGSVQICPRDDMTCERCAVETLDSLLAQVKPRSIDVVKIDVDNFECQVLQAGQSLFRSKPRFIQVQLDSPQAAQCVLREAAAHGYEEGGRQPGPTEHLSVFVPSRS